MSDRLQIGLCERSNGSLRGTPRLLEVTVRELRNDATHRQKELQAVVALPFVAFYGERVLRLMYDANDLLKPQLVHKGSHMVLGDGGILFLVAQA